MYARAIATVSIVSILMYGESMSAWFQTFDGTSYCHRAIKERLGELDSAKRFTCAICSEYGHSSG